MFGGLPLGDLGKGNDPKRKAAGDRGIDLTAGVVFSAGFSVIASTFAGLYLGIALDRGRQGTLFAPIGLIFGLLAGFHRVYLLFKQVARGRRK